MTTNTDLAQRRLLEAIAAADRTPGGIGGLRLGFQAGIEISLASPGLGAGRIANVWRAIDGLLEAVETDLHPERNPA